MKKETVTSIMIKYILNHKKGLALSFLSALIYVVVFYLYSLPLEAVLYGASLSATVAMMISIYDFTGYYRVHKTLHNSVKSSTHGLEKLPKARNLLERDYQNLIHAIYENRCDLILEADSNRRNMMDYYTLWAHQIKTPITAMRILLQSEDMDQSKELLFELFKIEQYVEMVLQYLRLEHMSDDLLFREYDLDYIIKQSVKKYAKLFIHKKVKLEYKETGCKVLTDEKWLVFVIEQILSNALKYTSKGKIAIYMDKNEEKTIVISDTGIGIQEEDLPRVFDKGFTGFNGRMNKKSTGIGLYLCKQVIRKLSHKITIQSQVGCGTKIFIDLSSANTFIE